MATGVATPAIIPISVNTTCSVEYHPRATREIEEIQSARDRAAISAATEKLENLGRTLTFPHSSQVKGKIKGLRELRPRGGRFAWRLIYGQISDCFIILAVGPDGKTDQRRFNQAVSRAAKRLDEIET